jgi:hypothetical protein
VAFDSAFAAAYIDNGNAHKILGVRLRPFCPWHQLLLEVVESPFLSAGVCYLYHLRRAVGICRLQFPNSRTKLPWSPLFMTKDKLTVEVEKFMVYITDYVHKPDYGIIPFDQFGQVTRTSPKPTPPPDVIQLVFDAAAGANMPVPDVWNMPIGQAYVAQAMYYQHKGLMVDFMNDEEREFQAKLKEYIAGRKNGNK